MLGGQDFDTMDNTPVPSSGGGAIGGAGVKWVVLLVALAVGGVWGMRQSSGPSAAYAAGPGKPMILMFTADWCGPCQSMKATLLSHPAVLDRLERKCRFRTVDLTHWTGPNAATAKYYGVEGVPTLMFVDASGREVSRYNGARDYEYFLRWIDQNAK